MALGGDVSALAALLERCRPSLYATAVGLLEQSCRCDSMPFRTPSSSRWCGSATCATPARPGHGCTPCSATSACAQLRQRREAPVPDIADPRRRPGPEETFEQHAMREWVWQALDGLNAEERITVMLRHFSRCSSYQAIAAVTGVPVGTVRSRLNRARARLADALMATAPRHATSQAVLEAAQRTQWEDSTAACTTAAPDDLPGPVLSDVDVRDPAGRWRGIEEWSAEERDGNQRRGSSHDRRGARQPATSPPGDRLLQPSRVARPLPAARDLRAPSALRAIAPAADPLPSRINDALITTSAAQAGQLEIDDPAQLPRRPVRGVDERLERHALDEGEEPVGLGPALIVERIRSALTSAAMSRAMRSTAVRIAWPRSG